MTKHDGSTERINLDKIHRVLDWAAEGLNNASISQVELRSHIQLYDGIKTSGIHETIIKITADPIPREAPDYRYLAARLATFHLCRKAYSEFEPPRLFDRVVKMVEMGKYDNHLLEDYTEEEFRQVGSFIVYGRDMTFSYAAVRQLEGKYLVQNRVIGEIYESVQFLHILIAACLFSNYSCETRLQYVERFYDVVSTFKIPLPTPIMSGACTPTRQFSSRVLIECGDNLDSINATSSVIMKYISQCVGIGTNAGHIRALGSPIHGGEAFYTDRIPLYRHFQAAVKSYLQGGIRGGAAALFYPMWHLEAKSLPVLKDNRGVEGNRVRHMGYGVRINKLMYTCLLKGGDIILFSPSDVPGLYDAFFASRDEFECLYTQCGNDGSIREQRVKTVELFSLMMQERASTGRICIQNINRYSTHGPLDPIAAPVRQSNSCLEVALPTRPLTNANNENGEIVLCALSVSNLGAIESLDELEELAVLAVRTLDTLLDYQDCPIPAAKRDAMGRRALGTGVISYVYWLAGNGKRCSNDNANNLIHKIFEAIQYYLLKASNELAKEQGARPWFNETTYVRGILPIDTHKKDLGTIANKPLYMDWGQLRESTKTHGLRDSTLSALMLPETSSQISNATNSIEPPCSYASIKTSKDGILRQIVSDYERLHGAYELLLEVPSGGDYLQPVGIMQKFIDQSIPANTNYDLSRFPSRKVPMQQLLKDLLTACEFGVKTLYYQNTRDGTEDSQNDLIPSIRDDGCESDACKVWSFTGWRSAYPTHKLTRDIIGWVDKTHPAVYSRQDSYQWHTPLSRRRRIISFWN